MSEHEDLVQRLREFSNARNWGQFHSPKNLVMALSAEVGELLEHFQWLTEAESDDLEVASMESVALEMADIFLYLLRLSDVLGVDLVAAANRKIEINNKKYPVETCYGSKKKHLG